MSQRQPETRGPRCAVCGKPQHEKYKPFCSKRCAVVDLGRWLKGAYAIPARDEDEGEGATIPEGTPGEEPDGTH